RRRDLTKKPASGRSRGPISVQGGASGVSPTGNALEGSIVREPNSTTAGTRPAGSPKMEAPQAFREMADKGIEQEKASSEKMNAATTEASNIIQNVCSTAAQGAMACNAKVFEFAHANSSAAFDYATKLLAVKSPSEFLELSTHYARKQFEALSDQSKELTALGQKVMLETAEPLKAGAGKAFGGHLG